jgi:hypothetical protein
MVFLEARELNAKPTYLPRVLGTLKYSNILGQITRTILKSRKFNYF